MIRSRLKFIFLIFICGLIILGIGYLAGIVISNRFSYTLLDVMFIEGLITIIIGILFTMKSDPSGISLKGLGHTYAQYIENNNLEVTALESQSSENYKRFFNNSVFEFAFSNLTIITGGSFIILFCIIYYLK